MRHDPNEWKNLANDPQYAEVIANHRRHLPRRSARPAPGSQHRILIYENGKANWEGQDIGDDDAIPEITVRRGAR
jgi:hypothetical protein